MNLTTSARPGIDWRATVASGLIGGAVFLALGVFLVPAFGLGNAWAIPRMMAAMILGEDLVPPGSLDVGTLLLAVTLHAGMSIGYAVALVALVHRLASAPALLVGALFGLALYVLNFHAFTVMFPWFAAARSGVLVAMHVVFGLVAAGSYELLERAHERRMDAMLHQ